MAKKKATEYRVIKTFDSPQGLKRTGNVITFKNDKDARRMMVEGYVELFEEPKAARRTTKSVTK